MKLSRIVESLGLQPRGDAAGADPEIARGYVSDMLSDVLANGQEQDVWITLQVHPNIVAVAAMKGVGAIVLINGREPAEETVAKAAEERIPLLVSELPAFELAGRLYAMGVPGQ